MDKNNCENCSYLLNVVFSIVHKAHSCKRFQHNGRRRAVLNRLFTQFSIILFFIFSTFLSLNTLSGQEWNRWQRSLAAAYFGRKKFNERIKKTGRLLQHNAEKCNTKIVEREVMETERKKKLKKINRRQNEPKMAVIALILWFSDNRHAIPNYGHDVSKSQR